MTKKTVVAVAVLVGLAGTSASSYLGWRLAAHDHPRLHAAWAFQSDNVGALSRHADAVFIGTAGDTMYSRTACDDSGGDCVSFNRTIFTVARGFKGVRKGQQIAVERLDANIDEADGGAFPEGATYLLFVKEGEAGTYYQINDESRFSVEGGVLKAAVGARGAAARLHDRHVGEISAAISGH